MMRIREALVGISQWLLWLVILPGSVDLDEVELNLAKLRRVVFRSSCYLASVGLSTLLSAYGLGLIMLAKVFHLDMNPYLLMMSFIGNFLYSLLFLYHVLSARSTPLARIPPHRMNLYGLGRGVGRGLALVIFTMLDDHVKNQSKWVLATFTALIFIHTTHASVAFRIMEDFDISSTFLQSFYVILFSELQQSKHHANHRWAITPMPIVLFALRSFIIDGAMPPLEHNATHQPACVLTIGMGSSQVVEDSELEVDEDSATEYFTTENSPTEAALSLIV